MIYRDNKLVKKVVSKGQSVSHRIKGGSTDWVPVTDFGGANRKIEPVSVERASTATYVDKDGIIKTAAANELRVDYRTGEPRVLVEGQATNLNPFSTSLSDWSGLTDKINNYGLAPDGTLSATKLIINGYYLKMPNDILIGHVTFSAWIKRINDSPLILSVYQNSGENHNFSIAEKDISDVPIGKWVRVSHTRNLPNYSGQYRFGFSGSSKGAEILIWGAQFEQGSTPTSYIPTNGTTVTRLADVNPIYNLNGLTTDRNSTATYVDADGLIKSVGPNTPRIDYSTGSPKVLVEKEATNLLINSENLLRPTWSKTRSEVIQDPEGTILRFTESTLGYFWRTVIYTSEVISASIEVKPIDFFKFRISNFTNNGQILFELDGEGSYSMTGTAISAKVKKMADGYYKLEATFNAPNGSNNIVFGVFDNTVTSQGYYIRKPQLEEGPKATSYIPTNGSTVTRLADNITTSYTSNRTTKRIGDKLHINSNDVIDVDFEEVDVYENILPKKMHEAIAPTEVVYAGRNIKAEVEESYELNPSLVMLPGNYEAGKLESIIPSDGSGDFTVDRNSTATRVNRDGLIEVVPANTPRIDWSTGEPMLLVEGQSSNLFLLQPSDEDKKTAIPFDIFKSIYPNENSYSLGNYVSGAYSSLSSRVELPSGKAYAISAYVRSLDGMPIQRIDGNTSICDFRVVIGGGTCDTHTIEHIMDNIYKVSATRIIEPDGYNSNLHGFLKYPGNNSRLFDFMGFQLEEGSKVTSYIPTNGSIVTRLADSVYKNNAQELIGQSEGTVFVEFSKSFTNTTQPKVVFISYKTETVNRIYLYFSGVAFYIVTQNEAGGYSINDAIPNVPLGSNKIAICYNQAEHKYCINGGEVIKKPAIEMALNDIIKIGQGSNNNYRLNDLIKSIKIYSTALTDAQLISMTTL